MGIGFFQTMIVLVSLTWLTIYTVSYGVWIWKEKNRLGAIMVFLVALTASGLPIYTLFIRSQ